MGGRDGKGKASVIVLSSDEQRELESLTRRRSTGQALALRARIVLAAAQGGHNGLIAARLGIVRGTVGKWRERFARLRLDGLYDEPRPGAPRQIGDDEIADTVRRTLETESEARQRRIMVMKTWSASAIGRYYEIV